MNNGPSKTRLGRWLGSLRNAFRGKNEEHEQYHPALMERAGFDAPFEKPIRVLFICTGNACRSQLAEAILRHYGGDRFEVFSAGFTPAPVHPMTLLALDEIGIIHAEAQPKHWNIFLSEPPMDYVITLCDTAAGLCPTFPGEGKRLHWPVDDPVALMGSEREIMEIFRRVRDEIAGRIRRFASRIQQGLPVN